MLIYHVTRASRLRAYMVAHKAEAEAEAEAAYVCVCVCLLHTLRLIDINCCILF